MAIDPEFPVYLKKMAVDPLTGNIYPALPTRPYLPGSLPSRFLNDEYCSQEGLLVPTEATLDLRIHDPSQGAMPPAHLRATVIATRDLNAPPAPTPATDSIPGSVVNPEKVTPVVVEHDAVKEGDTVNINSVTVAALATALKGVGAKTAEKVVQDRDANGPFPSLEALEMRSPLPFGRRWEEFKPQLRFE